MFEAIIKTLNSIEVHGRDNLAKLLGVIYSLEDLQKKLENPPSEVSEDGK